MKKFLFGCCLMLVGAICGTGVLVAHCCACVEPGAWSTVWNVFSGIDGAVILVFYGISLLGMAVALRGGTVIFPNFLPPRPLHPPLF